MYKHSLQYGAVFLTALFLTFFIYRFGLLDKVENITYDWRVKALSSNKQSSDEIVLVLVDQFSLEWMQKEQGIGWPWPREIYGVLNSFAKDAGAKAVVYDMIFSEESVYNQSDDIAFAESLKLLPTIGAIALGSEKYGQERLPEYMHISFPHAKDATQKSQRAVLPIESIGRGFLSLGVANATPDSDGVIRRVKLSHAFNGAVLPSLSLATYRTLFPENTSVFNSEALINYHQAPFSYQAYNVASLIQSWSAMQEGLEPTLQLDVLKNKVVFVGVSASGLFDQRVSPLSKNHPGVDIQATILDNLMQDSFIKKVSWIEELFYMLFFGVLTTLFMMHSRKWTHFLIPLVLVPLLIFALGYIYYFYGFWLNLILLLTTILFIIVFAGIVGYILEGRQKKYIKDAFSHYVSPAIVNKLVEFPDQLKLGGESRELSIFFSDIEGFTSLSERLEPKMLIALLHEYLDNLSTIIMDNEGTIDKYEGDAIIAFWNAPLDTKEHETLAVKTALACQQKLAELNAIFKTKYGVELKTRIGIHTGKVIVGNLGSAKHFDYSFIGDAGNLASRLEGVNKVFATDILVSKTTYERVQGIAFRKIGTIQVVGRKEALEVYQPLQGTIEDDFIKAVELFEDMQFEKSKIIFEKLCKSDKVAEKYLEIISDIKSKKMVWEGALVLSSK